MKIRRISSALLALCLVLAIVPATASATDSIKYPVAGGSIYFDPSTGTIIEADTSITEAIIPKEIDGTAVTVIGDYAFEDCYDLASVTFPETLVSIGEGAFQSCGKLSCLIFPDGLQTIGDYAFFGEHDLKGIRIPASVTSIGKYVFYYINNDKLFYVGYSGTEDQWNEIAVGGGNDCFEYAVMHYNYSDDSLPDIKVIKYTEEHDGIQMVGGFSFDLATGTLVNYDNYSFDGNLVIPSEFDGVPVTAIGPNVLDFSYNVSNVTIPASVTYISSNAFPSNINITIEEGNPAFVCENGVVYTRDKSTIVLCTNAAFKDGPFEIPAGVTKIENPVFPGNVTVAADNPAFAAQDGALFNKDKTELIYAPGEEIDIPASVVTIRDNAVSDVKKIEVSPDNAFFSSEDGVLYNKDKTVLLRFPINKNAESFVFPESVTGIGDHAFQYCTLAGDMTVPETVTSIGEGAFEYFYCGGRFAVLGKITAIGNEAFYYSDALEGIAFGDGITEIPLLAFSSCHYLEYVTIPESVTDIGYNAFSNCYSLSDIYYTGNENQWNSIKTWTIQFEYANIHFNSEGPENKPVAPLAEVFTDLTADWYLDAIRYVYENGLMKGTSDTTFSPDEPANRAMFVTILYRFAGEPEVTDGASFSDVKPSDYFSDAVAWAGANGIVGGYGDGKFGPNDSLNREQMVTILRRFAEYLGTSGTGAGETEFTDANEISDYARESISWATAIGIVQGNNGAFLPKEGATRAQIAAIMMRFCELFEAA